MIRKYFILFALIPMLCQAQTDTKNYVKTQTMLDTLGNSSVQAIQYYDGLGYPTVALETVGVSGQTAGTLTTYNAVGREYRKYVPVPGNGLDYMPESDFSSRLYFYQDNGGFTQNHYDALGRVTAVDIAGSIWRTAGKQDKTDYLTNTPSDHVLHYEAPEDGTNSLKAPENTSFRYYPAGSLTKVASYDADQKSVTVFSDMLGNKIMERTAAGDTYYVYNDRGQLRFVLMPEYQNNASTTINAYEYRYNSKGLLEKKYLPQCGVTQYWYDKADRISCMKDPALGSKYRFYLYDKMGRLCVQGTCNYITQSTSQLAVTTYQSGTSGICQTGYTAPYTISSPQLELVNYYDNYGFIGNNLTTAMPTVTINDTQKRYAKGSLTGSVVYATNSAAIGTISVYNWRGQAVRAVRKGLNGYAEDVSTAYSLTGAVDNTMATVNVNYGSSFIAQTSYTYSYGKKTKMRLSVRHGSSALAMDTNYNYDIIGRLSSKRRQITGSSYSNCSYTYDVHGWLTSINSGGFNESIYYADGLDGGCYNGNISTIKWKNQDDNSYQGYNLKYDGCNRLYLATYGTGDNLAYGLNMFNENVGYDGNGNITTMQRSGLVNKNNGGFGLVDNLTMTYTGNRLTSVRDDATRLTYTGATDFDGVAHQEYTLTYNQAGSLVSDAGRRIAKIEYDKLNNPVRIQFTNGNVTKYVYSATGEKLRVTYQTAVPNITVAIGSTRELTSSEIQSTDYVDYLLGGSLTLVNGRIDKYQFDEGYCQAAASGTSDNFTFCYYDLDHLGNIRQVTKADGSSTGEVIQKMNYYPFGAEFCDGSANSSVQKHKYNGKEFDNMHGLNTYDYGARQYNPVIGRWDRMDPLCEKYYDKSPYVYCANNPVKFIDPDGKFIANAVGALVGAGEEYANQVLSNFVKEEFSTTIFTDVDLFDISVATVEGAITCGGSAMRRTAIKGASTIATNALDIKTDGKVDFRGIDKIATGILTDVITDKLKLPSKNKQYIPTKSRQVIRADGRKNYKKTGKKEDPKETIKKGKEKNKEITKTNDVINDAKSNWLGNILNGIVHGFINKFY